MARHYTTRDFFRQMPNTLLARYFQGRGVLVASGVEPKEPSEELAIAEVVESTGV